ncbi:hypothetical protein AB0L40_02655 [Patulibacter sp. NPDC049589]|uniref:hypothetical protein n=1 Tax=Patulibacter sp. NPDC049589 TaxID=3154731 RepID=UPI003444582E
MPSAAHRAALALALVATGVGVLGCGDDPTGEKAGASKFAVYLGVPTRGPWGPQGLAISAGAELGLADSGGGAGAFSLRLSERDVTDDDGIAVGVAGAAREAGVVLRDAGAIGAISGLSAVSVREFGLLAAQTGVSFVDASGDDVRESQADLQPRGRRSYIDLSPTDAAVQRGLADRAEAAGCRRTVVADARSAAAGPAYDLSALRPVASAHATSWTDAGLRKRVAGALTGRTDCLVLSGDPSGGEPAGLLRSLGTRLKGRTVLLSRGAASQATARLVREEGLKAEAVVDDVVPDATPEGRRIDALYLRKHHTPAPVGVISGWRSVKLVLRGLGAAGAKGNRRDGVVAAFVKVPVPGPPAQGRQNADGTITTPALSVARAESYGWRAVRAIDSR